MARPLVDLASLDLTKTVMPWEEFADYLPQRDEFQLLDGVCHLDTEAGIVVAYKDWDDNPWWAKGHIPGRPLMPGVMMIEGCAQASVILIKKTVDWPIDGFIGLGGVDDVRLRGTVEPGNRVYFVAGKGVISGRRLAKYPAQAFSNGKMVADMKVLGILL